MRPLPLDKGQPLSRRPTQKTVIDAGRLGDLRINPLSELSQLSFAAGTSRLADNRNHHGSHQADTILGLLAALQAKDPYTARHSTQVEIYSRCLAARLGLRSEDVHVVRIAAFLHDVGKIGIPDAILVKPGRLTPEEFTVMKSHPSIGAAIIEPIGFLEPAVPLVLHHHEWYNGRGYPCGLAGNDIPFGARIIQVADSIDAMLSPRVYKAPRTLEETIYELRNNAGKQFDPLVANVAIQWLEAEPQCVVHSQAEPATALAAPMC